MSCFYCKMELQLIVKLGSIPLSCSEIYIAMESGIPQLLVRIKEDHMPDNRKAITTGFMLCANGSWAWHDTEKTKAGNAVLLADVRRSPW